MLADQGYFGIPLESAQRAKSGAFAGSKVAMATLSGDMSGVFEKFRQDHIENDPQAIEHFTGAFCPIPDAMRAIDGRDLSGKGLTTEERLLSTVATVGFVLSPVDLPSGTGMLDEIGEASDVGRAVARLDDAVDETLDFADDARRVSGRGRLGGKLARGSELESLQNTAESIKISVEVNDDLLDKLGKGAAFDYATGKIIVRSDVTELELFHELEHAKHWVELGRDAKKYEEVGRYARELRVYSQIIRSKDRWSPRELLAAAEQIADALKHFQNGTPGF